MRSDERKFLFLGLSLLALALGLVIYSNQSSSKESTETKTAQTVKKAKEEKIEDAHLRDNDTLYRFLLKSPHPLCQEFYYECMTNLMRPRVIVDYEREPWVFDVGTVRLTFDSNLRAAIGSFDIFDDSLPTLPIFEPGKLVMEVKYTELLPQMVKNIVAAESDEFLAVSKYVLCYEKTRYLNSFDYWYEA